MTTTRTADHTAYLYCAGFNGQQFDSVDLAIAFARERALVSFEIRNEADYQIYVEWPKINWV